VLIVGLTGGIASGKSTASDYFTSLGIDVIDADVISRQLVQPGQPALEQITQRFGQTILTGTGELDRAALRAIVFSDTAARQDLEAMLHPLIREEMRRQVVTLDGPYCILAIPLLIETRQSDLVERILVIDADEALQYQRLRQRDHLDDTSIRSIIQSQASRAQRLAAADDVVTNNGTVAELQAQLQRCHQHYLQLRNL
jgi:dephospho-CoA kinase